MARGDIHIIGGWGGALCGRGDIATTRRPCQECLWAEELIANASESRGDSEPVAAAHQSDIITGRDQLAPTSNRFVTSEGRVCFASCEPEEDVYLFGPNGVALPYNGEKSALSDADRSYLWAFDIDSPPRNGQRFVFKTRKKLVVGKALDGRIDVVWPKNGRSDRDAPIVTTSACRVSIVTCSYNRPDLLWAAHESLRRQTSQDWEHLVYDDASTDPRVSATLSQMQEDPRVRVWRHEKNVDRPASLWNFMIDRAIGQYITVLDDDNEKLPRFVERLAGVLDSDPSTDIVTCGWLVRALGGGEGQEYYLNLSTSIQTLDSRSTCDGGAMLYRREIFDHAGYFSEAIRTNEDWDWLRRAARVGGIKNLHECHSTYLTHTASRMWRCEALGNSIDVGRVRSRVISETIGVQVARPPSSRLTRSQEDVCSAINHALGAISWIRPGSDLAVVVSPFQMTDAEVESAARCATRTVSIHMEDPYAFSTNIERIKTMVNACPEVWVSTNDASVAKRYSDIVGNRVIVCPLLGADTSVKVDHSSARDIDVLLCGYAYPSRRAFIDQLLPLLDGLRVYLVGDGWEGRPCETMPTQDLATSYAIHSRARTVVCLHRIHGDCSDGPTEPTMVNRGFMEGYFGGRVFVDDSRRDHPFDDGDVVWYSRPEDLAALLRDYLADPDGPVAAARFAEKCATLYTYKVRVARILNCIRSPRFGATIP